MKNKTFWKFAIQTAISVLSAIATALGVTSCMAYPTTQVAICSAQVRSERVRRYEEKDPKTTYVY